MAFSSGSENALSKHSDGTQGAKTCAEVFEPHYGTWNLNSMRSLEEAIVGRKSVDEIGEALAGYYRLSDIASVQVAFDQAPAEVQDLDLAMRDAAQALIRQAGGNPEDFEPPIMQPISASGC